jgi:AraC-like DNA-binding protein
LQKIQKDLNKVGFELIMDPKQIIIEQIKTAVIDYIRYDTLGNKKVNFSDFLSEKLGKSYSYLSEIFSKAEGKTIERYLILQKIERVKELISYNEMNFSEIAYELNYSSVAHLSRQFKQITGMTLSQYRELAIKERKSLDKI